GTSPARRFYSGGSLAFQRLEPTVLQTALGLGALTHMLWLAEGRAVGRGLLLLGCTCLLLAEAAKIDDFGAHPALNPTGRSSSPDGRWRRTPHPSRSHHRQPPPAASYLSCGPPWQSSLRCRSQ